MKRRRYRLLIALVMALLLSLASWGATTLTLQINIMPSTPGGEAFAGLLANITPLDGLFTVRLGQAQVINGVELCKVELAESRFSNEIRMEVSLFNPQSMGGVLLNPNAYIEIGLWYEDEEGEHTLSDGVTTVSKDPGPRAEVRLTQERAGGETLRSSQEMLEVLYVLARITVPGGAPPGVQAGTTLEFRCELL